MQRTIPELVEILGLTRGDLDNVLNSPDPPLALKELKRTIVKQRRRLAKLYHPDLAVSKDTVDEDKMKEINEAVDILLKLKVRPYQQAPQPVYQQYGTSIIINFSFGNPTAGTNFNSWG